jgi:hypothetical protein
LEPLGDEPLELAEGLLLEDRADLRCPARVALPQDRLANLTEQRWRLLTQLPFQFFLPLDARQPRQLPAAQLQEPVHLLIDVGAARRWGRLFPSE